MGSLHAARLLLCASLLLLARGPALAAELGRWALDEASGAIASDASGAGHPGSLVGGLAWVPGVFGSALEFGGQGLVAVPHAASLQPAQAIGVAAWIRPRAVASQRIVRKARFAQSDGWELSLSSSGRAFVRFNQASQGDALRLLSTRPYPTDGSTWMHLAASFDGARISLYVDGQLEGSLAAPGLVIGANSEPLTIGADADGGNGFTGAVDDVHLFDRALSAEQVRSLMEAGALPPDSDDDGVPDASDAFPFDPAESEDLDGDGLGDRADPDDDGDGLPDAWELEQRLDPRDPGDASGDPDGDGTPISRSSSRAATPGGRRPRRSGTGPSTRAPEARRATARPSPTTGA